MKILHTLLILAISTTFSIVDGKQNLADFVTTTNLGQIRLYNGGVSDKRILGAFIDANPRLPDDLKKKNQGDAILYVSMNWGNRALIDVNLRGGDRYIGYVEVYFNGGLPVQEETVRVNKNLSTMTLDRCIYGQVFKNDRDIIQAFVNRNAASLSPGLVSQLKVKAKTSSTAKLYVPKNTIIGNEIYEGEIVVFFSTQASNGRCVY